MVSVSWKGVSYQITPSTAITIVVTRQGPMIVSRSGYRAEGPRVETILGLIHHRRPLPAGKAAQLIVFIYYQTLVGDPRTNETEIEYETL